MEIQVVDGIIYSPNMIYKDKQLGKGENFLYVSDNYLLMGQDTISFFVEGLSNIEIKGLKVLNLIDNSFVYLNSDNNSFTMDNIILEKIFISYKNYHKFISKSETMIKGEIYGLIDVKSCDTEERDLCIYCYRETDHFFIGEYSITNGSYTIPNLDANSYYDIVLCDKNRNIEQQVSSHRKPTPYQ